MPCTHTSNRSPIFAHSFTPCFNDINHCRPNFYNFARSSFQKRLLYCRPDIVDFFQVQHSSCIATDLVLLKYMLSTHTLWATFVIDQLLQVQISYQYTHSDQTRSDGPIELSDLYQNTY